RSSSSTIWRGVRWSRLGGFARGSGGMAEWSSAFQFFEDELLVRVDVNAAGDPHGLFDDRSRVQGRMVQQGSRGRQGIRTSGADRQDAVFRFDHVAGA